MLDKIGVLRIGATAPSWTRYKFVFKSDKINIAYSRLQTQVWLGIIKQLDASVGPFGLLLKISEVSVVK